MRPYKYAGYPMLIKTIELETNDDELFSKSAPLLTAASELAFHTINTSVLNAEELRREGGIAVSQKYAPKHCEAIILNKAFSLVKMCFVGYNLKLDILNGLKSIISHFDLFVDYKLKLGILIG